jgi:hypothetical protein
MRESCLGWCLCGSRTLGGNRISFRAWIHGHCRQLVAWKCQVKIFISRFGGLEFSSWIHNQAFDVLASFGHLVFFSHNHVAENFHVGELRGLSWARILISISTVGWGRLKEVVIIRCRAAGFAIWYMPPHSSTCFQPAKFWRRTNQQLIWGEG